MGPAVPFVESVPPAEGPDEVLDNGPWAHRLDRLFAPRLLRGLFLAAAATAVVANFGGTPVATGPVSAPLNPASTIPDVAQNAGVPIGSGPPYNHAPAEDPAACPAHLTCAVTTSLPASVLSALSTDLPGVRVDAVSSTVETAARRIRFRQINATYRGADILVRISRPAPDALQSREETDHVPAELVRFVAVATPDGFEVQVQLTGSPWTTPPIELARLLAHDRRLLAPA